MKISIQKIVHLFYLGLHHQVTLCSNMSCEPEDIYYFFLFNLIQHGVNNNVSTTAPYTCPMVNTNLDKYKTKISATKMETSSIVRTKRYGGL